MGSEETELRGIEGRDPSQIDTVEEVCSADGLGYFCCDGSLLPFPVDLWVFVFVTSIFVETFFD